MTTEFKQRRLKVTELFSPPRPTALPRAIPDFSAFAPGSIFDLRYDRDGLALDFLRADHRSSVRLRIKEEEPYLVVDSPPRIEFTDLFRNSRAHKVDPQVVRERRIEAQVLLRFACEINEMQMAMGNHFLHEHPAGAGSWGPWTANCRRERSCHSGGRVPRKAEQGRLVWDRLREGRGPPQPAVRSLRLGTGLYNLSPDARDKPMKVDCAILQDHVRRRSCRNTGVREFC